MDIKYFDISRIITISVHGERPERRIQWIDAKPIKKFWGLYNTGNFKPAGYYYGNFDEKLFTEQEIRDMGYKVYSRDERISENVVIKSHVSIELEQNNSVIVNFETEAEMLEWVDKIITSSDKTYYKTIVYK